MVPVLKNVEERYTTKNYCTVSQVFEKLVNIRIFDHLEIFCFFSDFQYGFRSCRSSDSCI